MLACGGAPDPRASPKYLSMAPERVRKDWLFVTSKAEREALLVDLANTRMPFGKYKERLLIDLPEAYLAWFARQGFPAGKLGVLLESTLAIKLNGLEHLVRPLRDPAR